MAVHSHWEGLQFEQVATSQTAVIVHLLLGARLHVHLRDHGGALALLHHGVDVQHALVARREDWGVLQQLQDLWGAGQTPRVSQLLGRASKNF